MIKKYVEKLNHQKCDKSLHGTPIGSLGTGGAGGASLVKFGMGGGGGGPPPIDGVKAGLGAEKEKMSCHVDALRTRRTWDSHGRTRSSRR